MIEPYQFADVKAFMGDTSDGYPGVKGIGPKTALQLIQNYGSVENVLANLDALKPAQRSKIADNVDMLKLSKELATIQREVPINAQLNELQLVDYEQETFERLQERGLSLIVKHARSLYSLV